LFDVESDPYETNNLAKDLIYADVLNEMRDRLGLWIRSMPDLSFYPEHHLIATALDDPVSFGKRQSKDISAYVDIADLSLVTFERAKVYLDEALESQDPWKRYWALIVCSSFGQSATELTPRVRELVVSDPELINQVRAAEYLALASTTDPGDTMIKALYNSKDGAEALLILNSIVLMKDGFDYSFNIDAERIHELVRENPEVKRRLKYLAGL
ncbi:MAG: hypothetical protein OEQ53_19350, partial [Saprospiraceae bacterium]|nr:hypothetical protein [Saprospiraceae bacterium]